MTNANFAITGIPKYGTTALTRWLARDFDTFISDSKEPLYCNKDWGFQFRVSDAASYAASRAAPVVSGEGIKARIPQVNL